MKTQKIFKVICDSFGHKFSFNAETMEEATMKLKKWCSYHSFYPSEFKLEETTDTKFLQNDFINTL